MRHDITLDGGGVRLIPLDESNVDRVAIAGSDPSVWQFTFQENPFTSRAAAQAWLCDALEAPDVLAFAVVDRGTGQIAGTTRYFDVDRTNRKLEIGWTYYAPRFWRTHVNTECKFLLLRYAFEDLDMARVQFKAEAINARSRAAIARIGALHEGTLRNFRIRRDGERRDVSVYSIVDAEWIAIKERLLSFLEIGADRSRDSRAAV